MNEKSTPETPVSDALQKLETQLDVLKKSSMKQCSTSVILPTGSLQIESLPTESSPTASLPTESGSAASSLEISVDASMTNMTFAEAAQAERLQAERLIQDGASSDQNDEFLNNFYSDDSDDEQDENEKSSAENQTNQNIVNYTSIHSEPNQQPISTENLKRKLSSETEKIISEKLNQDNITSKNIEFSLNCPLSKQRMVTPVRFNSCTHLDCMDLSTLLKISRSQGFNPNKPGIFNADKSACIIDREHLIHLDDVDHDGAELYSELIKQNENNSPDEMIAIDWIRSETDKVKNWISKSKYEVGAGKFEKVANFMVCPICNNNVLRMMDLEVCDFSELLLSTRDENESTVTIELIEGEVKVKETKGNRNISSKRINLKRHHGKSKHHSEVKIFETSSGNFEVMRVEMNSENIPVIELE